MLLRQARSARLLARLAWLAEVHQLLVPDVICRHFLSERIAELAQRRGVEREVNYLCLALNKLNEPLLLLKGAAYVVAGLSAAQGRSFNDIDILVPKNQLEPVEKLLHRQGWAPTHANAYDQRYYRQWMHEIPPLQHVKRQTILDVHHNILPETARWHPDPKKLMASAEAVEGNPGVRVLCPVDMVLHSATHLFTEGELDHGLRDLVDMDALLRGFCGVGGFWPELLSRAEELDLTRPLYYALRYTRLILLTPVPDEILAQVQEVWCPRQPVATLMDALYMRALMPVHPSSNRQFTGLARWLIYVRSHYLRMPLHLLLPHLLRKAWVKWFGGSEK